MRPLRQLIALKPGLVLIALVTLICSVPGVLSLPVLDRDEARFAQSSAQMAETGNFIDIKFLDENRHKKPVGIYWLQAMSAKLTGGDATRMIWPYRLPSLLGGLITVVFTALAGRLLFGPAAGLCAGLFLGVSVLLGSESGIAKTDAMLAASCAIMMYAFIQLRLSDKSSHRKWGLVFWGAIGFGILLKGPVTPMVAGLALAALIAVERDYKLVWRFIDWPGLGLASVIILPWFIAIQFSSGGAFLFEGLVQDITPKLISGHESHGGLPGTHTLLIPLLIFPGILFLPAGIAQAVKRFRMDRDRSVIISFCLLIPAWLVFEIIPTKLPHYTLPVYPVLAWYMGLGFVHWSASARLWQWTGISLLVGVTLIYVIFLGTIMREFGGLNGLVFGLNAALLWSALMAGFFAIKAKRILAAGLVMISGMVWHNHARAITAPMATELHLSSKAMSVIEPLIQDRPSQMGFSTYTEPSLVFLSGGYFQLSDPRALSASSPVSPALYVIDTQRWFENMNPQERDQHSAFLKALFELACHNDTVSGFNYSTGTQTDLMIIQTGCE